jgi:hypothetical protein
MNGIRKAYRFPCFHSFTSTSLRPSFAGSAHSGRDALICCFKPFVRECENERVIRWSFGIKANWVDVHIENQGDSSDLWVWECWLQDMACESRFVRLNVCFLRGLANQYTYKALGELEVHYTRFLSKPSFAMFSSCSRCAVTTCDYSRDHPTGFSCEASPDLT